MITKLVVKDYVAKGCKYLAKAECDDKTLVQLIKKMLPLLSNNKELLKLDDEFNQSDDNDSNEDDVLNLDEIIKQYPNLKKEIKEYLNNELENGNEVQKLVNKYHNDQLISELSRKYIENMSEYKGKCVRCDLDANGDELLNQEFINNYTTSYLKDEKYKVLFEGQIDCKNLRARFDILFKNDDGTFDLIEVKGTNNVCTHPEGDTTIDIRIKDKYLYDLLFQYFVYKNKGMKFRNIGFLITNSNFELSKLSYPVHDTELNQLFKFVTELHFKDGTTMPIKDYFDSREYAKPTKKGGESKPLIENIIFDLESILKDNFNPIRHYECKKGPACPLLLACFADAKDSNSVFKLTNWGSYGGYFAKTKELMDKGIYKISEIPDYYVQENFPVINEKGKRINVRTQIDYEKDVYSNKYVIDRNVLKKIIQEEYLDDLIKYLIFFDFESFQHPIPLVKNSKPWKQVVSQYSMHVVKRDYDLTQHDFANGCGGNIKHYEFIGNPDVDGYENPSFALYETLKSQLLSEGIDIYSKDYRVVVFNKSFEKSRMSEFVEDFGSIIGSDMTRFVNNFNDNVVDLLDFFTKGGIYGRDFYGRGSLKVVQPSLTENKEVLDYYNSLDLKFDFKSSLDYHKDGKCLVYNGSICLDLYKSLLIREHIGESNVDLPTKDLLAEALAYCKIDSWGTVIIFDIIKNIIDGKLKLDAKIF